MTDVAPAQSTPFLMPPIPELATRIAVTLGVLAIYRVGVALPMPGVDVTELYRMGGVFQAVERLSVFALGVVPLITALLVVEVARLVSDRFNDWSAAPVNARRVNRWALAGALLLAAIQAYSVAVGLEGISFIVGEPGPEFRLAIVTTLVGGTALLAWLAALISRHGVGSGLWVLLLAPWLARSLPDTIFQCAELARMGLLSRDGILAILAYGLVAVAGITALALALARRGMPLERTLIWPLYIGSFVVTYLAIGPGLLPDGPLRDNALPLLRPGAPLYLAALALVIFVLVTLAHSRRAKPQSAAEDSSATPAALTTLTALALAAIAVAPYLFAARLDVVPVEAIQITAAVGIVVGMKSLRA
jgi:preprotein translocase subunit SecY